MKNFIKSMELFLFVAIIGFTIIGCNAGTPNGGNIQIEDIDDADLLFDTADTPNDPQPFVDLTAAQITANITIGWNLGNTLDTHGHDRNGFHWLGGGVYANTSISEMETAWGNPVTTRAMIDAVKNAGFNTIRIPVTWYKAADSQFRIRQDWMARVVEIVNFAVDNDMYIILNTHHDEEIFKFAGANVNVSKIAFERIWKQIAHTFKNYNEKLIFEALNEPRTKGVSHEWSGGTPAERAVLNQYYQIFVDTVRASGGNNDRRVLMVNTYAASALAVAMNALVIPNDTIPNKIIVSIHAYEPFQYAHEFGTANAISDWTPGPINSVLDRAHSTFVSKGIPVVMGEFGVRRERHDNPRAAAWAEHYVRYAKSRDIPCIWWDDGGGFRIFTRNAGTFHPGILNALMRGLN
jgi:endoglucanase